MKVSEVSLLQAISSLPTAIKAAGQLTEGSLIEYTKPARVEPIVMIDDSIRQLPMMEDLMQVLTSMIAGYYLQAVQFAVTKVGNVDTIKVLDKLNPNRGLFTGMEDMDDVTSKEESYKYQLPVPHSSTGLEAYGIEADKSSAVDVRDLKEIPSLALGKMLEVNIENNGSKTTIPVNVRLIPIGVNPTTMVNILDANSKGKTIKDRWAGVKSGRLNFIRDFILCQDLIDEYRNSRMKDTNDVFGSVIARRNKNRYASVLSGEVSVATASNIMILSDSTLKELESKTGMRMRDFRSREQYFKNTYTMLMVVVDPKWEQVTIYHRSVDLPSEFSAKEMKMANSKSGGPDVAGILQAYKLGNNPSLL